ncbi:MAG: M15 family metallopeptidase [Armatimonas sp.]
MNETLHERLEAVSRREPIAALNAIKEIECGESLVDLRKSHPRLIIGRRCIPFLRERVAQKLIMAADSLPEGYAFSVRTCMRSYAMQKALFDRYFAELKEKHPDWSYATLRRQTCRFFAPYDQKAPPGHCTGAAVDVHLLLPSGHKADLVKPLSGWKAARSDVHGLGPRATKNREILFAAMISAGFSNCGEEFWHYSWGDAGWAVRVGAKECVYGLIELPTTWTGRRK